MADPWRYSTQGISVALRVTPRGGRDDIDGVETLANGRSVVKVRVRAIADGYPSVTPLQLDLTAHNLLKELQQIHEFCL